jgi:hypothetical protein
MEWSAAGIPKLPSGVLQIKMRFTFTFCFSLLSRNLQTKHANLKNKPQEFFERELKLLSSKKCIKATDTINNNGLETFYMVSYRVARTDKPYTMVSYRVSRTDKPYTMVSY